MKRKAMIVAAGAALAAAVAFYAAPFQGKPQPVNGLIPTGALLTLEARDFHAELTTWNASPEKQRWLTSARHAGFANSNLYLKLEHAWEEFGQAAGFPADWNMADSLAGRDSALALYNIGNLEFLYVTRLPGSQAMQTVLWQSRAKYELRHAGSYDFYVRTAGGRTVAFASAGDCLFLATREEYLGGALRLLSGEHLPTVADEEWYKESATAAGEAGDIRMVMNLAALVKTPQFRSYWIQRNASEVRQYTAGIADIHRSGSTIREDRVFVRTSAVAAVDPAAESIARLAPEGAAFYRAWSHPQAEQVARLVEAKILAPVITAMPNEDMAPEVNADVPNAGDEVDLETRIDQPPLAAQADLSLDGVRKLIRGAQIRAAIQVQSGERLADGVFLQTPSAIGMEGAAPWDAGAVRAAVAQTNLPYVQASVQGNLLVIANSADLLRQVMDRAGRRSGTGDATSIAAFRHAAARPDYLKLMNSIDQSGRFFAIDLASLSNVFRDVREVELRVRDRGAMVRETVEYR